jgi:phosphinothricin acetyltransferase
MQEGTLANDQAVTVRIRSVNTRDAEAVLAIYGPIVATTAISFETEIPSVSEIADRIEMATATHPWLVAVENEQVIAYAYAGPFNKRAAYRPSTEVSIYVGESARGKGVGRGLLTRLLDDLRTAGFANAFAGTTLPNDASSSLFESLGFVRVATFHNVGFKLDAWHDVGWWQLELGNQER